MKPIIYISYTILGRRGEGGYLIEVAGYVMAWFNLDKLWNII